MPSVIVLDTNAFTGASSTKPVLQQIRALLEASGRGDVEVAMPEIALRESVNRWAEAVEEAAEDMNVATRALQLGNVLAPNAVPTLDLDQLRETEEARVRAELAEHRVAIVPLPTGGHDPFVTRALQRNQPFDKQGRNGYRDVLLWEAVLSLVRDGSDVILVSSDKDAFYDRARNHRGTLSRTLLAEAEELGARAGCVEIVNRVALAEQRVQVQRDEELAAAEAAAREAEVAEAAIREAEVAERRATAARLAEERRVREEASARALASLVTFLDGASEVDADFREQMAEALTDVNVTSLVSRMFGIDVYEARIDVAEVVSRGEFKSAYMDETGYLLVEARAAVSIALTITADPSTIFSLDRDNRFNVYNIDLDNRIGTAATTIDAGALFDAVFTKVGENGWQLASLVTFSEMDEPV